MYSVHGRLCVCLSFAEFQHYCMDPDVTWGNSMGCLLVVHYWADLQLVHRVSLLSQHSAKREKSASACTEMVRVIPLRRTLVSSALSECANCLQCFDTVGWMAGRASGR